MGCDLLFPININLMEVISIHAPRVGCDIGHQNPVRIFSNFNPRTPGGVRLSHQFIFVTPNIFQSTHPGWGATICARLIVNLQINFNPRTPGGVRRFRKWWCCRFVVYFNPRTPGGVRHMSDLIMILIKSFQSTHPGWGATLLFVPLRYNYRISIHAPRVGCDR